MLHISMTTAHYKLEEDRLIANLARDTSVNTYKPHIRTTLQCVAQEICLLASSSSPPPPSPLTSPHTSPPPPSLYILDRYPTLILLWSLSSELVSVCI